MTCSVTLVIRQKFRSPRMTGWPFMTNADHQTMQKLVCTHLTHCSCLLQIGAQYRTIIWKFESFGSGFKASISYQGLVCALDVGVHTSVFFNNSMCQLCQYHKNLSSTVFYNCVVYFTNVKTAKLKQCWTLACCLRLTYLYLVMIHFSITITKPK